MGKKVNIIVITFSLIIFLSACNEKPKTEMFITHLYIPKVAKAKEKFEVNAELLNNSNKIWTISHAGTLFSFVVLNEDSQIISTTPEVVFLSRTVKELIQDDVYSPDSQVYNDKIIQIQIDKPGKYKIVASSNFSIENDEEKKFNVKSKEIMIEVLE